ncbi:MAG: potassium channel protein [Bacteroidetes bacterium]|jgi:voltage-gated potassium channel|nr:potassium channel protein [Bacteroidota bacterium]
MPYRIFVRATLLLRLLRQMGLAIALILGVMAVGVLGLMLLEDFGLVDALYMTIITVSTVGFHEVQPLDTPGKLFISGVILTNIGIFAYAVSNITAFFMDGGIRDMLRDHAMNQKIARLKGHVVVCGYGRIGQKVVDELMAQGAEFVIVEQRKEQVERHRADERLLFVEGNAIEDEVMTQAGIEQAGALICTMPDDAANVFVVLAARQRRPDLSIVSRASLTGSASKLKQAGADHVVMPELIGGNVMAGIVTRPHTHSFLSMVTSRDSDVFFEEIDVSQFDRDCVGQTLRELDLRNLTGASVIGFGLPGGRYIINPDANEVIRPDSKIVILGNKTQIGNVTQLLKPEAKP